MLQGIKGRGLETKEGVWEVHLLDGHNGALYIAVKTPGEEPVILQAWKESDFDSMLEVLKSALEPKKVTWRCLE